MEQITRTTIVDRDERQGDKTPKADARGVLARLAGTPNATVDDLREGDDRDAMVADVRREAAELARLIITERPDEVIEEPVASINAELSLVQAWLGGFKARFDALPKLHKGVNWVDVEKSLRADPDSMAKLMALDANGHNMNVCGEENGEFIFISAWDDYEKVAADHRNIAYDAKGQELAERRGYKPNGNAVSIIAKIMGVQEDEAANYLADPKLHERLRKVVSLNGWAWHKTDAVTREAGDAFSGYYDGFRGYDASDCDDFGSFRAALRVKKA